MSFPSKTMVTLVPAPSGSNRSSTLARSDGVGRRLVLHPSARIKEGCHIGILNATTHELGQVAFSGTNVGFPWRIFEGLDDARLPFPLPTDIIHVLKDPGRGAGDHDLVLEVHRLPYFRPRMAT